MKPEYYTVGALAQMFGVNNNTIREWLKGGKFPGATKPGGTKKSQWRIPRSAVEAAVQERYGHK